MAQCPAISDPNSAWPKFCPSLAAAYIVAIIFAIATVAHIGQAIHYRKWYCLVIIVSAGMQTGNFVVRILSINNVTNQTLYSDWFILMMIAPIWTNAYAYMIMGRIVYNFTSSASVFKIKAWYFGTIFVLFDICAFLIQLAGLATTSSNVHGKSALTGIHIYMGGIVFQQICIVLFLCLAVRLHLTLRSQPPSPERSRGLLLLTTEYVVVLLITVRIIFRLIEYSNGLDSSISRHEAYEYIFDSALMWIAIVLFNVFHPGRLMPGKEAAWPSRKERRAMRKRGEVVRGRAEHSNLLPQYESHSMGDRSIPQGQYEPLGKPTTAYRHSNEE